MIKKTFFISGHRDITIDEFNTLYKDKIKQVIKDYNAYFVVGDYEGVDILAQDYLINELKYDANKITVYFMGDIPNKINSKIKNLSGGYQNDIDRDTAMTNASDEDIAYVRKDRWTSGTAQNILRRYEFTNNNNLINLVIDKKNSNKESFNILKDEYSMDCEGYIYW